MIHFFKGVKIFVRRGTRKYNNLIKLKTGQLRKVKVKKHSYPRIKTMYLGIFFSLGFNLNHVHILYGKKSFGLSVSAFKLHKQSNTYAKYDETNLFET